MHHFDSQRIFPLSKGEETKKNQKKKNLIEAIVHAIHSIAERLFFIFCVQKIAKNSIRAHYE